MFLKSRLFLKKKDDPVGQGVVECCSFTLFVVSHIHMFCIKSKTHIHMVRIKSKNFAIRPVLEKLVHRKVKFGNAKISSVFM